MGSNNPVARLTMFRQSTEDDAADTTTSSAENFIPWLSRLHTYLRLVKCQRKVYDTTFYVKLLDFKNDLCHILLRRHKLCELDFETPIIDDGGIFI